jgi:peptidyl-prolyl cis-trans isomerase SurA
MKPSLVEGKIFDRVVAKVNSEIITLSSIEARADVLKQKYMENYDGNQILLEALEMMIDEKLQIQQGKKMGFEVDDITVDAAIKDIEKKNSLENGQLAIMLESEGKSIEAYRNNVRDQILVSKITRFELGSRVSVSKRNIEKYYHDNQKEYWELSKARVKHILILFEKGASEKIRKKKNKRIKEILAELKEGKDFAEAAKEYSEDISASIGGDVGFIVKGQMVPEFEKAVYRLKEGEISDVVETEYGYHIIKAEEIQKGRTQPFKEVENKIKNILLSRKQKSAYKDWMSELRESAFIEISLFGDSKKKLSSKIFDSKTNHKDGSSSVVSKAFNKKKKREMEDKWKEMYKSVEKTKGQKTDKTNSHPGKIEQNLREIKKLRYQEKISEAEYQKRKQKILEEL